MLLWLFVFFGGFVLAGVLSSQLKEYDGFSWILDTYVTFEQQKVVTSKYMEKVCAFNTSSGQQGCTGGYSYSTISYQAVPVTHVIGIMGVKVGDTEYLGENMFYDAKRGVLIKWSVPIGDRNFKEYGYCLDYELKKGVCVEQKV